MTIDPARAKSLFLSASDLPGIERAAYLDRECGTDAQLVARVEALLAADEGAGPVPKAEAGGVPGAALDATAEGPPAQVPGSVASSEQVTVGREPGTDNPAMANPPPGRGAGFVPGQTIAGRYTLLEVLGEGGMGTVYRAGQTQPVRRQVALKLIKLGMDTRQVLARFDAERQALAVMDHPNIARVYDGGATDTGQPFFVMELVNGVPITRYCDEHRCPVRARLELFVSVCHAVQHAHQKGIIHRDLKPSNVLVTDVDGRPTPKVIDFGVARATEFDLTDRSLGETGAIVGTPAYMSPEQAVPSSMDIDARTDVYALGVILYESLTGSPPIDSSQFKRVALLEMLRMVREVDPPKPSTKVSTAHGLPGIAATRDIDPQRLKRELRGDLDWIVMKALEKDRERRYELASGFAADVLRHLACQPVLAAPPSLAYRLRKFVRRHRGRVVAATLLLLALLAGSAGTTFGLLHASRAREQAIKERTRADLAEKLARERGAPAVVPKNNPPEQVPVGPIPGDAALPPAVITSIGSGFHGPNALTLDPAGDLLVSDAFNGVIRKILPDGRTQTIPISGHGLALDPAGNLWVARGNKNLIYKISPAGEIATIVPEHADDPIGIAMNSSGNLYLANRHGHTVNEVSPAGKFIRSIGSGHRGPYDLALDSSGNLFVAESDGNAVRAYNPAGTLILALPFPRPLKVTLDVGGSLFVACAGDGTIKEVSPDGSRKTLVSGLGTANGVAVAPSGRIYACDFDANRVYEIVPQDAAAPWRCSAAVRAVAVSPDDRTVLCGGDDHLLRLCDMATGKELKSIAADTDSVRGVAFSPDGRLALSGGDDHLVKLWDLTTGTLLKTLPGHTSAVTSVAFSPDGRTALSASADKTIRRWDLSTGKNQVLSGHTGPVNGIAVSRDGRVAVSASDDGTLKVWDLPHGTELQTLHGHDEPVFCTAISPDGHTALSGSRDTTLKLWDLSSGKELRTLRGHARFVLSVAFSPDGRTALSASSDKTLRQWDLDSGQSFRVLQGHTNWVSAVAFRSDGMAAVSASEDDTVRSWDLSPRLVSIQSESARRAAQVALDNNPGDAAALATLGRWHAGRNKAFPAVEFLEKARVAGGVADPLQLAQCYWQLSDDPPLYSGYTKGGCLAATAREYRSALGAAKGPQEQWHLQLCLAAVGRSAATQPTTVPASSPSSQPARD